MFLEAYLHTAADLIKTYPAGEPFQLHLKHFFSQHKKFGSRDRKQIAHLCYCWFRAGHALQHLNERQQFLYALFLCSDSDSKLLQKMDAALYEEAGKSIDEKIRFAEREIGFKPAELFPWHEQLSPEIEPAAFYKSLLIQPNLFLRLRPGRENVVKTILRDNAVAFENISGNCIALANSTKADTIIKLDADAVVQDLNSQQTLNLVKEHGVLKKFAAWDCCAASGGKSLLLSDTFSNTHITVSDVREGILYNLRKRFGAAGVKGFQWFVADATKAVPPRNQNFDLIICDAPCSGSGTWSRTPEQLHYFEAGKIAAYASLQKNITANVSQFLKKDGLLLYITCSVFKQENEDVVAHISSNTSLNFLKSAYYKGYDKKADTLFAALFNAS